MTNGTGIAHVRPVRKTRARLSKIANARDTIHGFGHGMDIVCLTLGQFSLLDLIQATLELTGPANVSIATWAIGLADMEGVKRLANGGPIRSIRFLMDSGLEKKGQASSVMIAEEFGDNQIRTTRSHNKFVIIENDDWHVVITTSMNLNANPRCEQFEMTDDPERCALFAAYVDALFGEIPAGGGKRPDYDSTPVLAALPGVQPRLGIEIAGSIEMGAIA